MDNVKLRIIFIVIGIAFILLAFLMKKFAQYLYNKYRNFSSISPDILMCFSGIFLLFGILTIIAAIITK